MRNGEGMGHNPEMAEKPKVEAAKMDKAKTGEENYLDSKNYQATQRLFEIASAAKSPEEASKAIAEALAKDPEKKAIVDDAFADDRWNPEPKMKLETTAFSQPDPVKSAKFNKPMQSWTDNPVARKWRNENPNADQILENMGGDTGPDAPPIDNGDAEKARAERTKRDEDDEAEATERIKQIKDEIGVPEIPPESGNDRLDDWMNAGPDQTGGIPAADRGKRHPSELHKGGSQITGAVESSPIGDVGPLSAAIQAADARGAETIVHDMTANKPPTIADRLRGGWNKLFGGKEAAVTDQSTDTKIGNVDQATEMWMANSEDNMPDRNLSAGSVNENTPMAIASKRRVDGASGPETVPLASNLRVRPSAESSPAPSQETQQTTEERKVA